MRSPPLALCALLATTALSPAMDYPTMLPALEEDIRREMREWHIGGITVALVDDQRILYAAACVEQERPLFFDFPA